MFLLSFVDSFNICYFTLQGCCRTKFITKKVFVWFRLTAKWGTWKNIIIQIILNTFLFKPFYFSIYFRAKTLLFFLSCSKCIMYMSNISQNLSYLLVCQDKALLLTYHCPSVDVHHHLSYYTHNIHKPFIPVSVPRHSSAPYLSLSKCKCPSSPLLLYPQHPQTLYTF